MSIGHRVIFERDITQTELPWDYGAAVAQGTHNPLVVGSNPSGPKLRKSEMASFFYHLHIFMFDRYRFSGQFGCIYISYDSMLLGV